MDLYDLFATIRDAVAQDANLGAWATTNYSKSVTVFAGLLEGEMPDAETHAPFVVLGDPADARGMESRVIEYAIEGYVCVATGVLRTDSLDNVVEPAGLEAITDFVRLLRAAIQAGLPDNVFLVDFNSAFDTTGAGGAVNGFFDVTLVEHLTIGSNPLA